MKDQIRPPDPTDGDSREWEALARYLAGESDAEEAAEIRAELTADPARADLIEALDLSLDRLAFHPPPGLDVEAALARIRGRMDEPAARTTVDAVKALRSAPRRGWWSEPWLQVAAGLLLLAAGALLLWQLVDRGQVPLATYQLHRTAVGQIATIALPDGSQVVLGPGSELIVDAGYGDLDRAVELSGDAYFVVDRDEVRPFLVRAGGALVMDLGTAFTIRERGAEGVRVVVTEGAVALRPADDPSVAGLTLRAGDRGALRPDGSLAAEPGAATDADLAWTRRQLVFEDTPLAEVAVELRRWYGLELRFAEPALAARTLTATFADEPVERVVGVIGLAIGAPVEVRGDTATLGAPPP